MSDKTISDGGNGKIHKNQDARPLLSDVHPILNVNILER